MAYHNNSNDSPLDSVHSHSVHLTSEILDFSILDFAIIGAGISGLTLAKHLQTQGYSVVVFEKARGTGGRLSSKRVTTDQQNYMAFDLGCASITANTEEFIQQLKQFQKAGIVSPWWQEKTTLKNDQTHDPVHSPIHYVATPRNSALTRYLSQGIECHFSTRIHKLVQVVGNREHKEVRGKSEKVKGGENYWQLLVDNSDNQQHIIAKAKNVILAIPPAQAYDLLPKESVLKKPLELVDVDPQWVMGIEVEEIPQELPELSMITHNVLYSISRETLKPGRAPSDHSVLQVQATAEWTRRHLDVNQEQVSQLLIEALAEYMKAKFDRKLSVKYRYSHRWLYSQVVKKIASSDGYLFDQSGLGLVGDYFEQPTSISKDTLRNPIEIQGVESAWLSAQKLAQSFNKKIDKSSEK